jgi:cytochrome c peroxidase
MRAVALAAVLSGASSVALAFDWAIPHWLPPPPVPSDVILSEALVDLGRHLFYDPRLSADGTMSCASCHEQVRAFTDGRKVSVGVTGQAGTLNVPALANVGYLPTLTWANPMVDSLEFHALIPLFGQDPVELGNAGLEQALFARLMDDSFYQGAFARAFPDRAQADLFTITRALGAFQRSLISVGSPYDQFVYGGDRTALSAAAVRGMELFFDHRLECYHCHLGLNFTNNLVTSRSAMPETGFHNTGLGTQGGMEEFTLNPRDRGRFRTPSLRNVAVTAPYMHDGRFDTLEQVIHHYAAGGEAARLGQPDPLRDPLIAGFTITDAEIADLTAFLESLTDEKFLTNPAFANPW